MKILPSCIDWVVVSSLGSILSGVFTILLYFLGRKQINKLVNSSELDVYYRLKYDFSSFESKSLLNCIVSNELIIVTEDNKLPKLYDKGGKLLLDDLLNHIEDLCIFYDKKLISKSTMVEGYGSIVLNTFQCQTIIEYIIIKRSYFKTPSLHTGLEKLYKIINE